ncbi:MAG: PAS domain S-box protein [Ginsengibacter sp.]
MNISIKKRIYWSFSLLVSLFVINGIITIITLNNNKKLSEHVSTVTDPSLQSLEDFEDMLVASKMYTTNWVFLRSNKDDKDALKRLHEMEYPSLKMKLNLLSPKWDNKYMADSLQKIYTGFEQLLVVEKRIMSSLQTFENYDDPVAKLEAERLVEDELLPRTSSLINSLSVITSNEINIRNQKNKDLEKTLIHLRVLISVLAITIIFIGILLSLYMARVIVNPINKIRHIVNDLGKGITSKVSHKAGNNEIGEMVRSVNNLSEKLLAIARFAHETGLRNFDIPFKPLSDEDTLGKALIAMRDNIRSTDEKLNQAQHTAKLGSFERDISSGRVDMSDEMFTIFDIDPVSFDYNFQSIVELVHPDDLDFFKNKGIQLFQDHKPVGYECRMVTTNGVTKNLFVQVKLELDTHGNPFKTVAIIQDISERKRVEEKLSEERELFRLLIENIPDQIYLKDTESRFLLCNMPGAINAGCKSQADIIGKTDFDFYPPESAKHFFDVEQALMRSGKTLINQEDYVPDTITGEPRWSLNTKVPVKDHSGKMIGLIGINRDITQRKISEKKIEDVNRELSTLFNSIDEIFFSVNMTALKVIQISPTCEKLYGYKQSQFMANYRLWLDIIHPDDKYIIEKEDEVMRRGEQVNNEYRIVRNDKSIRWVENRITPTLNIDGKLTRIDGITRDITERKTAEIALLESQRQIQTIFNAALDAIVIINEEGKIVTWDSKAELLFGWKEDEVLGMSLTETIIPHKHREAHTRGMNHFLQTGEGPILGKTIEVRALNKNNHELDISLSISPSLINDKYQFIGFIRDITSRKKAETELHNSEERYRRIVETAQEGIWIIDENDYVIFFNQKMCELVEYSYEEMKGKRLFDFMDSEGKKDGELQVAKRKQGINGNYDVRYITKSGKGIWTNVSTSSIFDDDGKYQGALAMVTDITERKMAEKERQEILDKVTASDTLFKEAESIAHFGTFKINLLAKTTTWSDEMFRLLGYKPGEVEPNDENFSKNIHPDDMFQLGKVMIEKNGRDLFNMDYRVIGKNDSVRHIRAQFRVERDGQGKLLSIIGINQNITERKNIEEQIKLSNERYGLVTKTTNDMIWDWDLVNNKIFRNENYSKVFGPHAGDRNVVGKWFSHVHAEDKDWINDYIKEKLENPDAESWEIEFRYYRSDNEMVYLNDRGYIIRDENKKAIRMVGATCDITERKEAEEKLIQSEKYSRNLFNQSPVGLALACMDGTLEDINEAYADIIGRTIEECRMLGYYEITPEKYKAQESACMTVLELTGRYGPYEKEYIHKDGHLVPVRLSGTVLEKEGIKYIWSSVEDITDIKMAEEAMGKSEARLEIKNRELEQKNKELEQFAYVASHDLQEPLRTTISFVEIFKQQYFGRLDSKADKYLSYIVQASDRMRVLIEDLLDFSRIGINKEVEKVDCNMVLQDVITDIDKALKDAGAEIKAEYLPVISGYAIELKQLFQNLILNSIKFRKKDVPLKIDIEAEKKDDYWRFAFTDNGIGIEKQHNERIFIIFQRLHTRSEYQGSGIGLSHCKKIVELHHGKIWVESKPGVGSTFYFTIHSPKEKINEPKIKLYNDY